MTRTLIVSNLLLASIVALQAWWLHAAATGPSASARLQAVQQADGGPSATREAGMPSSSGIDAHLLSMQLARIEQRLASLEPPARQAQGTAGPAQTASSGPAISHADADRRLAQLLPVSIAGRADLELYRARLSTLTQAEQAAVEAALSRAINQDRVRLRL